MDGGKCQGLTKVSWSDVRERVHRVNPNFAKIVDELKNIKSFPLYLAYYPFGETIADAKTFFIFSNNKKYKIGDANIPAEVYKNLSYGKNSLPMGMVLEKQIEYFIDLKKEKMTLPWCIYKPGTFFPLSTIINSKYNYTPNGVLETVSGTRSIFMLPNIGCFSQHINLQRDFNVKTSAPKSLYDHWFVFKEIAKANRKESDWQSCILFFSEPWIKKLADDKSWLSLKIYLLELAWERFQFARNNDYYGFIFSIMQKNRNLKPNPYLADTARHLFTIALGAAPGYSSAINEEGLPLKLIQKSYIESYGLKKYFPTIIEPQKYLFNENPGPVYYSLQNPTTLSFSPKSCKVSSTLIEMRELQHIMKIYLEELSKLNSLCSDTILSEVAKTTHFNYFHNEIDRHQVIKLSSEVNNFDNQFNQIHSEIKLASSTFATNAKFLRGCISISTKERNSE